MGMSLFNLYYEMLRIVTKLSTPAESRDVGDGSLTRCITIHCAVGAFVVPAFLDRKSNSNLYVGLWLSLYLNTVLLSKQAVLQRDGRPK